MSLNPVDRALECLANNLSREELVALNRRIRLFRFCLTVLLVGAGMACATLFPRFNRFSTETIFVSASSWNTWHSFQILYILTILAPTLVIYYLASSFIAIQTPVHAKVEAESLPLWAEIIMILLVGSLICAFFGAIKFTVQ